MDSPALAASGAAVPPVAGPDLTTSLLLIALLVAGLLALPWLLRRWQQKIHALRRTGPAALHVVAAMGIGPQQRVVTVEATQPDGQRVWLVLGISPQNIHCLHVMGPAAVAALPAGSAGVTDGVTSTAGATTVATAPIHQGAGAKPGYAPAGAGGFAAELGAVQSWPAPSVATGPARPQS